MKLSIDGNEYTQLEYVIKPMSFEMGSSIIFQKSIKSIVYAREDRSEDLNIPIPEKKRDSDVGFRLIKKLTY